VTTIRAALEAATERLRPVSPTARLDAEVLLATTLGLPRAQLIARLSDPLPPEATAHFDEMVRRRGHMEPIAYLTGTREFYGLDLAVDPRVLVPRPETELLVDLALHRARSHPRHPALHIADIGTGSGAIAIAVAANLPEARVWAVDISRDALEVARSNVERHHLQRRITLLHGDGLTSIPGPVDLLLTNPPYTVLAEVDEPVRRWEPHLALDGGAVGLEVIRRLIDTAPRYLRVGSMLVEIGAWQGEAVTTMARRAFPKAAVQLHRDLAGHDRVLEITLG
jgi:release factor glutamine methyltransferase